MNLKTLIVAMSVIATNVTLAQHDFEKWYDVSSTFYADNFYVRNLATRGSSSNDYMFFLGQSFTRSEKAYEGMYSAKLSSKSFDGEIHPASFANGVYNINYLELDFINLDTLYTIPSTYSMGNHVDISCYYTFDETKTGEYGLLTYKIFSDDNETVKASGQKQLDSSTDWRREEIVFNYDYEPGDRLMVVVYGNHQSTENAMYLDSLTIKTSIVSTIEEPAQLEKTLVYPSLIPANNEASLTLTAPEDVKQCMLVSSKGQLLSTIKVYDHQLTIPSLPTGLYFLSIGNHIAKVLVQ